MSKKIENLESKLIAEAKKQIEEAGYSDVTIRSVAKACGIVLESAADIQKNNAKKVKPRRFMDTGLYRIVRCPNYLGEMIFWTGVLISGIGAVSGIGQWLVVIIGYAGIIFVMFSGARRLEIRQNKTTAATPSIRSTSRPCLSCCPLSPCTAQKSTSGWSHKKKSSPALPGVLETSGKAGAFLFFYAAHLPGMFRLSAGDNQTPSRI